MNIFEQAARQKFRFPTAKGELTVEQLWELPLKSTGGPNLDDIALTLDRQLSAEGNRKSFVDSTVKADGTIQVKLDIVKHIIEVKIEKRDAEAKAQATRERDQRIMAILEKRKDAKLDSASDEELLALLNKPV